MTTFFAVVAAVLAGVLLLLILIIFIINKLSLLYPRTFKVLALMVLTCSIAGVYNFVHQWQEATLEWNLANVPSILKVNKILYYGQNSVGFGPGANEAGLLIYALPDDVAANIRQRGMQDYARYHFTEGHTSGERELEWEETPVKFNDQWLVSEVNNHDTGPLTPDLSVFLDRYAVSGPIDDSRIKEVQAWITQPGNYYTYMGINKFLIINPMEKKLAFAYAG